MAEKIKRRKKALESISANETNKYTNRLKQQGYSDEDISKGVSAAGALGETVAADPFLSRNEFKKNFYKQIDQPPITAETMHGKGTKRFLESPIVDPDSSMMQNMAEGGSVRGQKNIQVKKKAFRGVF